MKKSSSNLRAGYWLLLVLLFFIVIPVFAAEGDYIDEYAISAPELGINGMYIYSNNIYIYNTVTRWDEFYMNGTATGSYTNFGYGDYGGGDTNGTHIFRVDANSPERVHISLTDGTNVGFFALGTGIDDPTGLAYNSNTDRLYIGDTGTDKIHVYTRSGTNTENLSVHFCASINGITTDNIYIYYVCSNNPDYSGRIHKLNMDGTYVGNYTVTEMGSGSKNYYPYMIDHDGEYFYILGRYSSTDYKIFRYDYSNPPPTVTSYDINPDPPHEDENVQINATFHIAPDVGTVKLEWMGTTNYTVTTNSTTEFYFTILSGNYTAHDTKTYYWYATGNGKTSKSAQQSFTVANQLPTVPTTLTLTDPIYVTSTLTASGSGSTDADAEDNPLTYYYEFYNVNDSSTIQAYSTDATYVIQVSDAHDKIRGRTKAYDGYDYSNEKETNRTVSDTIPTIPSSVILNDTTLYTNDHVLCTGSGSSDADNDAITYFYKFNKTGTIFQNWSTNNVFDCSTAGCDKNDVIHCYAKTITTLANSTNNHTSTTILNTIPTLPTSWTNLGTRLTDHTPAITWTEGTDVDGDTVTTYVYVGTGSTPTAEETHTTNEFCDLGNTVTLSDSTTYYYRLRSHDGTEFNPTYTTSDEFYMNGLPTTVTPTIVPAIIYSTTSEIMCENGSVSDPESDATTLHYEWYKDDVPLSLDLKNITNGNYTAGDVMICEIWVADPYETNTTKLNSSSVTIEGYTPSINWNYTYLSDNSIDMTPAYGETIKINANVTDGDGDLEGVYFTLLSPNGSYIFETVNGTVYNSDLWNSTLTHTIDSYGSWMVNISANDSLSLVGNQQWNFSVSLGTLSFLPTSKIYSQKAGETESFNMTFNHNGNSNNTINMTLYGDLLNASRFTIDFYEATTDLNITNTNFTVQEGSDYILKVNITSDVTLTDGVYTSNITFERKEDNNQQNLSVSVTISALAGNVILTPETWSISMDSVSTSYSTFKIENDGDYDLTHCNGSISTWTSYDSYNNTDFNVTQGNHTSVKVTVTNIPAGTYSKELIFSCIATPNNGIDTDTTTISATISQYTAPEPTGGGGGGGDEDLPEGICGNGVCEWDETWNISDTTRTYCPQDCLTMDGNVTIKFDVKPPFYTVLTQPGTIVNHRFKIENYNSNDYNMHVYITCQPNDTSYLWVNMDSGGDMGKELMVMVPGGTERQPGVKLIDYMIDIPSDAGDLHRFSIVIENSTVAYRAVYPVTMDMRFGLLTWWWMWMMGLLTGFVESWGYVIMPFERSLFGLQAFTLGHVYIMLFFGGVVASVYIIKRYSDKYRKGKSKKNYFDIDMDFV